MQSPRKSSDDLDIVKRGEAYLKRPPSNSKLRIKAWQKRYLVLRDDTPTSHKCLEVYKKYAEDEKGDKYIVDIRDAIHIGYYKASSTFTDALVITLYHKSPLMLGFETRQALEDWFRALRLVTDKCWSAPNKCTSHVQAVRAISAPTTSTRSNGQDKEITKRPTSEIIGGKSDKCQIRNKTATFQARLSDTSYLVKLRNTADSYKFGIAGVYTLHIEGQWVSLLDMHSKDDVAKWNIEHIKKFRSERLPGGLGSMITLETGSQCKTIPGTFSFRTRFGKEIMSAFRASLPSLGNSTPSSHAMEPRCKFEENILYHRQQPVRIEDSITNNSNNTGSDVKLPIRKSDRRASKSGPLPFRMRLPFRSNSKSSGSGTAENVLSPDVSFSLDFEDDTDDSLFEGCIRKLFHASGHTSSEGSSTEYSQHLRSNSAIDSSISNITERNKFSNSHNGQQMSSSLPLYLHDESLPPTPPSPLPPTPPPRPLNSYTHRSWPS